ncbi:AraC family transcriptional regulator [bacterium]|nr:AraC family transcriptional regulator [bacterium]
MKRDIAFNRKKITNDLMHYIYENIESSINLDALSEDFQISKFHMHRIFKEEFGVNIYAAIQSIRLQKAANLLITNKAATIYDISLICGYSSQTSFIRAFIARFSMTPTQWRKGGFLEYSNKIIHKNTDFLPSNADYTKLVPEIKKMPSMDVYYIRHRGYDEDIQKCWQNLQAIVLLNEIETYKQIALYHDNPIITPLKDCNYVACVSSNEFSNEKVNLPFFKIHEGVYAEFSATGYGDDILNLVQWVYHEWLPTSGFEATVKHSYMIYEENNFLNKNDYFSLKYYIPIILA